MKLGITASGKTSSASPIIVLGSANSGPSENSTSLDGSTWINHTTNAGPTQWNDISWSPELSTFLGISTSSGAGDVAISSDGIVYTTHSTGLAAPRACCWSSTLQLYIACGHTEVSTSSNGTSWSSPTSTAVTSVNRVTASSSLIVSVGNSGQLQVSSDGTTWISKTSSFGATAINGITYGNSLFVAVGSSGKSATSSDGNTWTQYGGGMTGTIGGIAYSSSLNLFVAMSGGPHVYTSPDGTTWTEGTFSLSGFPNRIAWCPSLALFVIGSSSGDLAISSDGFTWSNPTSNISDINSIGGN